jgi:hypothetical protein
MENIRKQGKGKGVISQIPAGEAMVKSKNL